MRKHHFLFIAITAHPVTPQQGPYAGPAHNLAIVLSKPGRPWYLGTQHRLQQDWDLQGPFLLGETRLSLKFLLIGSHISILLKCAGLITIQRD